MLNNGDKLVVTKTIASFLKEGDVVEVRGVSEDGIISFAFGNNFMHMGVMNSAECESHFKKIEEKVETPTITEEYIDEIMENSAFDVGTAFDKCTIVACRLPNGFVITESSACVNPEDYDKNLGFEICKSKIKNKVWELEAYRLQQWLWEESVCDECDECDECNDCNDCDCYDCEVYECPSNPNY